MKIEDLRKKDVEQLKEELYVLRKETFTKRLQNSAGHLSDFSCFKKIRRDIARIKTLINEKTD